MSGPPALTAPADVDLPRRGGAAEELREVMGALRSQGLSREAVEAEQVRRLRQVVAAARDRVHALGHLRELPLPESMQDVLQLPILTKESLQGAGVAGRLAGPPPAGTRRITTSGSTGVLLEILWPLGALRQQATLQRAQALTRSPLAARAQVSLRERRFEEKFEWRPHGRAIRSIVERRVRVDPYAPIDEVAQAIRSIRAHSLAGHAHRLVEVADGLGSDVTRKLEAWTYGEQVDALTRQALTERYRRPPLDEYGVAEVGAIAWQCRAADLYHVHHLAVLLEVLDPHGRPVGPGGTGEVVVTSLVQPLMPVVRYRVGDSATVADRACACGRRGPLLQSIDGRTADGISTPAGMVPGQDLFLFHFIDQDEQRREVSRYRVVQRADGSVAVEVVPAGESLSAATRARLEDGYRAAVHNAVPIEIREVPSITIPQGRKFRLVASELTGTV